MQSLTRITFDPQVMGGKPCIRGMRVTVGTIVGLATPNMASQPVVLLVQQGTQVVQDDSFAAFDDPDYRTMLELYGGMRAQVMSASQGMSRPTGWHYHECEGQFVYMMKGWVDLQFEDGRTIRVEEGDSLYIPGYLRHNEIRTSDTMEILEVSVPGKMGTTPCDPPAGFKD